MDALQHHFGISLPDSVNERIKEHILAQLFDPIDPVLETDIGEKDAFYADATPVVRQPNMYYPIYTAQYLGIPLPADFVSVTPQYRRTAAVAALKWLEKQLPYEFIRINTRHFNGEIVTMSSGSGAADKTYSFMFPDISVRYKDKDINGNYYECVCPVIPWADSFDNDGDWENATTPYYAEAAAILTLDLWRESYSLVRHIGAAPSKAYIVRITGNTPGDIQIRTVVYNAHKSQSLWKRLYRALDKAAQNGQDPVSTAKVEAKLPWMEKRQQDIEDAFHVSSPEAHSLVEQYMNVQSSRKTLEQTEKAINEQMEALAVELAAMTNAVTKKGIAEDENGNTYVVSHVSRTTAPPKISAAHIRQFYPELLGFIRETEYEKGRVSIDVL